MNLPRHPCDNHLGAHLLTQDVQYIGPIMHPELGECLRTTHVEPIQTCQGARDGDGDRYEHVRMNTHRGRARLDVWVLAQGQRAVDC
jgi:hypothetical protein